MYWKLESNATTNCANTPNLNRNNGEGYYHTGHEEAGPGLPHNEHDVSFSIFVSTIVQIPRIVFFRCLWSDPTPRLQLNNLTTLNQVAFFPNMQPISPSNPT